MISGGTNQNRFMNQDSYIISYFNIYDIYDSDILLNTLLYNFSQSCHHSQEKKKLSVVKHVKGSLSFHMEP